LGRLIDGQQGLVVTVKNVYSGGYLAVDTDRNLLAINDSKSSATASTEWLLESAWLNGVLRVRLRSVVLSNEYLATGRNGSTWSRTPSDTWQPVKTDWILNNYFPRGDETIDRYSVVSAQGGEYLYTSVTDDGRQTICIEMAIDTTSLGVWIDEKNQWDFQLILDPLNI
jgi:hypothetical protein